MEAAKKDFQKAPFSLQMDLSKFTNEINSLCDKWDR